MTDTATLRADLRSANKLCSNPREKWNKDGTVTVDGDSYLASRRIIKRMAEIDTALWELEQLREEQAKWVRIPRIEE